MMRTVLKQMRILGLMTLGSVVVLGLAATSRLVGAGKESPDPAPGPVGPDAQRGAGSGVAGVVLGVGAVAALGALVGPALAAAIVLVVASAFLFVIGAINLRWLLDAWWTPGHNDARAALPPRHAKPPRVSLLVPARHEVEVLGGTLDRLAAQQYEDMEVVVIVGHDDPGTDAVARQAAERLGPRFRVVVDHNPVKNKPLALNLGLEHCTGDIIGVFDAEDDVHPEILDHVCAAFAQPGVDIVQGPVQLMNHDSRWFTVHNVLEYFFYFGSRLHHHARNGFIPLGGNTVFVRSDLLREAGGWDTENLTEDCELGVRLSTGGANVRVLYRPELATREEAPVTVSEFVRQRSRWNQGFLQTYRKGIWRDLPLRQRLLARIILMMPLLQAASFVVVPATVAMGLASDFALVVALFTFLPLAVLIANAVVQVMGLRDFGRLYNRQVTLRDQIVMVVGIVPYGVLLTYSAFRAVLREAKGNRGWEKTAHVDAHRGALQGAPA